MRNDYEVRGDIVAIFLTKINGDYVELIIDKDDFEKANLFPHTWSPRYDNRNKTHYVTGSLYQNGKKKQVIFHRWLLDCPEDKQVDHINHNTLDNRRGNLRIVEPSQNSQNRRLRSDNSSGYRGVTWDKSAKRWRARVRSKKKTLYTCLFDDVHEAGRVAEEKRLELMPYLSEIKNGTQA